MPTQHSLLNQARDCRDQGRFVAAADLLLDAFREDPEQSGVARDLGLVLHAVGDLDGACDYLIRAHHMDPTESTTLIWLVQVLQELGRPQDAAQFLVAGLSAGADPAGLGQVLAA